MAYAQGAPPQMVLRNNRVRLPPRAREHSQLGDKLNKKYPLVSCGTGMRYRLQETSKQVEHRQSYGCTPRHEHKRLGSSVEIVRQTPTVPHSPRFVRISRVVSARVAQRTERVSPTHWSSGVRILPRARQCLNKAIPQIAVAPHKGTWLQVVLYLVSA